jgi:8-amino-3,8-dideoxy-alpha-D-manno-octulosonate transaminase
MPGSELFGAEERKEVMDVLETGIMFRYNHDQQRKGIWKAKEFERELADFVNVKYAHVVSSGSTAVATMMAACGIGAGDEVIVPPFTYIATVEGALLNGAIPVFAEIDDTLCLSPEGIRAAITPKTKAVVLVQMCGAMARMDEIINLCKEQNIMLIEDTAQALGASYRGQMLGTFGIMGAYSFDFFKIITAGEGGAIITNNEQLYKNADMYSDHGHDHIGDNRGMENHPVLGFNYRISELHAAVGLAQLRKIKYILEKKKANKRILKEAISKYPEVSFRFLPDPEGDSATFLSFFMPTEDLARATARELAKAGIGVNYWYDNNYHYIRNWEHLKEMKTIAKIPIEILGSRQDYRTLQLPQSDLIMGRLISIGIRITWTEQDLANIIDKIEHIFKEVLSL